MILFFPLVIIFHYISNDYEDNNDKSNDDNNEDDGKFPSELLLNITRSKYKLSSDISVASRAPQVNSRSKSDASQLRRESKPFSAAANANSNPSRAVRPGKISRKSTAMPRLAKWCKCNTRTQSINQSIRREELGTNVSELWSSGLQKMCLRWSLDGPFGRR